MLKIGITGQAGFIGTHLFNTLGLYPDKYEGVQFEDNYFNNENLLYAFVCQCDVIVHLAALSRHSDQNIVYETNIRLIKQLIGAMESKAKIPHILFSSSIQEENDSEYGRSKREGRKMLEDWAEQNNANFTGMLFPNVFGPFGKPNYASFIATFCYKLTHGEVPEVFIDSNVKLIYSNNLINKILSKIDEIANGEKQRVECDYVNYDFEMKVTDILKLLEKFKSLYFDKGIIPKLKNMNEVNLFNTFICYFDYRNHYPAKLIQQNDSQGVFSLTPKSGIGGQISFSKTAPGMTRGNCYHTQKIERIIVIKGKAKIQMRRIGTAEVMEFYLNGTEPEYVDIPIWHTYNITNIGDEELNTQFWTNEWFVQNDNDTYFETVEK